MDALFALVWMTLLSANVMLTVFTVKKKFTIITTVNTVSENGGAMVKYW